MHEGKGGSYVRDKETGKLTLVQRTEEAKAAKPASDGASSSPAAEAGGTTGSAHNPITKPTREK
ncbi:hypothetical protein ABIA22_000347 [Sinorhizobium fredii]|uniref:hypothetical protein n=1 Tax=Rhizobium fredii TaxID=380 RepID=UPI0035136D75